MAKPHSLRQNSKPTNFTLEKKVNLIVKSQKEEQLVDEVITDFIYTSSIYVCTLILYEIVVGIENVM